MKQPQVGDYYSARLKSEYSYNIINGIFQVIEEGGNGIVLRLVSELQRSGRKFYKKSKFICDLTHAEAAQELTDDVEQILLDEVELFKSSYRTILKGLP